jgi:hypothetical protein
MSDETAPGTAAEPPVPVCVCTERWFNGVGATPPEPKPQDVAVLFSLTQRWIGRHDATTPLTNYILKLVSSSSRAQNNTNLRLRLGGVA